MMLSSTSKRLLNQRRRRRGVARRIQAKTESDQRTRRRASREEPNISSPAFWLPSPISVFVTLRAFFDVASESTMIAPAPTRNPIGVSAGPLSESIRKPRASPAPFAR